MKLGAGAAVVVLDVAAVVAIEFIPQSFNRHIY